MQCGILVGLTAVAIFFNKHFESRKFKELVALEMAKRGDIDKFISNLRDSPNPIFPPIPFPDEMEPSGPASGGPVVPLSRKKRPRPER
jgi:hypothetical protein